MRSGDDPDDAAVPVQADERGDTDRPHHLMESGPAHEGGDPLVEAREVRQVTLQRGPPEGQARMVVPGRLQRLQAGQRGGGEPELHGGHHQRPQVLL